MQKCTPTPTRSSAIYLLMARHVKRRPSCESACMHARTHACRAVDGARTTPCYLHPTGPPRNRMTIGLERCTTVEIDGREAYTCPVADRHVSVTCVVADCVVWRVLFQDHSRSAELAGSRGDSHQHGDGDGLDSTPRLLGEQ